MLQARFLATTSRHQLLMKIVHSALSIILITIMQLPLKQNSIPSLPQPNIQAIHNYSYQLHSHFDPDHFQQSEEDQDQFSLSHTSRNDQPQARIIRRSMVNRSCINTCSYTCRNLTEVPPEIKQGTRLSGIQRLDLSFNSIKSITQLPFQSLSSLKQLMLNDNQICELPHHAMNNCKQLRLINLSSNQLTLIPPLTSPSYILARNNPVKLITSQMRKLANLEFVTLDWMEYLLDAISNEGSDRFKDYAKDFLEFKRNILEKIDYSRQENCSYCDFHCLFSVRLQQWRGRKQGTEGMLAMQAARAILRGDSFFLNYLRNFHNEVNYASLTYNSRLLLQTALETGKSQALDLFKLRKNNYAVSVDEEVYFSSLRACCRHSSYDIFKYLIHIRSRRRVLQTQAHLAILIKQVIEKYNKEQDGDKILFELMRFWKDTTKGKIVVKLPTQFSHKLFKSISTALLDILSNPQLAQLFEIEPESEKTTPLHFAMRSRNQQLIEKLLQKGDDVFQKNNFGQTCKFVNGSTQVSRKMIWRREKQIIKKFWKQNEAQTMFEPGNQKSAMSSARSKLSLESVNNLVQSRIGYENMQAEFLLYRKPIQDRLAFKNHTFQIEERVKHFKDEEILPHLRSSVKVFLGLNWQKQYLKKMVHSDVVMFLLSQIDAWKEDDFLLRLQRWGKAYSQLFELFNLFQNESDCLLQYQIAQTMLRLTGGQNSNIPKPLQGGNFWCCQNVIYE